MCQKPPGLGPPAMGYQKQETISSGGGYGLTKEDYYLHSMHIAFLSNYFCRWLYLDLDH
jgi:hypothetical protein